jgi:DNA-binding IscR family transcriptional regulator
VRITSKCSIAIHCLLFIHEYGEHKKVTSGLLALSTGCNPVVIRNIISKLKQGGILTISPGAGGARLACPPREITLYRICILLEPESMDKLIGMHPSPSALCPVGRSIHSILNTSYERIRQDMVKSLQTVTLDDVIAEYNGLKKL